MRGVGLIDREGGGRRRLLEPNSLTKPFSGRSAHPSLIKGQLGILLAMYAYGEFVYYYSFSVISFSYFIRLFSPDPG